MAQSNDSSPAPSRRGFCRSEEYGRLTKQTNETLEADWTPGSPPYSDRLAERLRESLACLQIEPIGAITASYGISVGAEDDSFASLIRKADVALLAAKTAGRNRSLLYDEQLET